MATTKINRQKPNCFLLQNKLGDLSGGFAFRCHALGGTTLSGSRSLLRVCTQSVSLCFLSHNEVPSLFGAHELFPRFTSLILLTLLYAPDKSIPMPQSRRHEDRKELSRCSLWLSKAAVRDRSAEFSRASWAILCSRLEETTIKHFSAIPVNARNWNDWPHISDGCEHTWQLTAAGYPFLPWPRKTDTSQKQRPVLLQKRHVSH